MDGTSTVAACLHEAFGDQPQILVGPPTLVIDATQALLQAIGRIEEISLSVQVAATQMAAASSRM